MEVTVIHVLKVACRLSIVTETGYIGWPWTKPFCLQIWPSSCFCS